MKYPHINEFDNHFITPMGRQNGPFCFSQMTLCHNERPRFFNELRKIHFSACLNTRVPYILL